MSERTPRIPALERVPSAAPPEITYHRETDELNQLNAFVAAHSLPLLTAEQEVVLARDIKTGLESQKALGELTDRQAPGYEEELARVARGKQAKLHFMHANFRLVADIARKYYGSGLPLARKYGLMDMFNVGIIGLSKAIDKYDPYHLHPEKPGETIRFSTPAVRWIKQEIIYNVREKGGTIRIPAGTQPVLRKIHDMLGAGLTRREAQEILELSDQEMLEYMDFVQKRDSIASLDADLMPDSTGELSLHAYLPDPRAETDFQNIDRQRGIEPGLSPGFSESAGAILQLLRKYVNKQDNTLLDKIAADETLFQNDLKRQRAMSVIFEHPAVRPQLEVLRPADVPRARDWRDEAACKDEPELYARAKRYSLKEQQRVEKICGSCAVRQACEAFFMDHQPERGHWIDGRSGAEFDARRQAQKKRSPQAVTSRQN